MKSTAYALLIVSFVSSLSFAAEPSAFGAGDLTASKPYGLTQNEKVILQTKNTLKKVAINTKSQANALDSLRERIDGIQSVVENLSIKSHNNKINLERLQHDNQISIETIHKFELGLNAKIDTNTLEIEKLKNMILEISKVVDTINKSYVNKNEFNKLVSEINDFKSTIAKQMKNRSNVAKKSARVSSAKLYNQAKAYFDKKYFTKAIQNYKELIQRKYKPAYAHYMIGEMNFRRKNYAEAISYFKKSASLYDKAKYMPKLMLHAAISMDKTGDKQHAKAFYEAIVTKYPNSKEAHEANKYLGLI